MANVGQYRDHSDEPLSEDERRTARRLLSDPTNFPPGFKEWIDNGVESTVQAPPVQGLWKVWDHARVGDGWTGELSQTSWTLDVPGVTQYIGGRQRIFNASHPLLSLIHI